MRPGDGALDPPRHARSAVEQPGELGRPLLGLLLLGVQRALGLGRGLANAGDRLLRTPCRNVDRGDERLDVPALHA